MTNETIGMILSLLGMCANVCSFQVRKKGLLLTVQTVGSILFSVSFFFAGGGIGGIINLLLLVRNLVFMGIGDRKGKGVYIAVGILCLSYLTGLLLYNFVFAPEQGLGDKLWNILPVLGGTIGTVAFSVTKLNLLRKIKLGDSACWLAYNAHIGLGALGGILCEAFSICSIGIALFRFREKGKEAKGDTMKIFRGKKEFAQFAEGLDGKKVLIVCDVNTAVFATDVVRILRSCGKEIEIYRFEERRLVPEIARLDGLLEEAKAFDYILAVGSGTLNDICKYASFTLKIPYGVFATAPSMDGYASSVSALYDHGKKVTLSTTIPCDVLIDINVLKSAPLDMIVAGAGDMIGKYTSLLDWKFAHRLNGEGYEPSIVARMEQAVVLCMSQARELISRNEGAVSALIEGLILSGIEMQNAGNSRPASGCEHHVSHYLEMAGEKLGCHFAPHGVQVALGSLVGISLYRYALAQNFEGIALVKGEIEALPTVEELKKLYQDIGLPVSFAEIGVDGQLLVETVANAYVVRERFTVMSFLKGRGALDAAAKIIAEKL